MEYREANTQGNVSKAATIILDQITQLLNREGCATGNEHGRYTLLERVENLLTIKNYWVRQTDTLRSEAAFMERMGYVLAMRVLQSDAELDGEESGAIGVFVPQASSVGAGVSSPATGASSENPAPSTELEEIARLAGEEIRREVEKVTILQRGFHTLPQIIESIILAALTKASSLRSPDSLET